MPSAVFALARRYRVDAVLLSPVMAPTDEAHAALDAGERVRLARHRHDRVAHRHERRPGRRGGARRGAVAVDQPYPPAALQQIDAGLGLGATIYLHAEYK